jgi:hypothetical protein
MLTIDTDVECAAVCSRGTAFSDLIISRRFPKATWIIRSEVLKSGC